ncbi:MAG: diacylglycerol kinase family protein [Candidatus Aminicenantes bacterium]|nr:diacylglycerol kinase family protein [Candidatus Aminicenantes bacterium]
MRKILVLFNPSSGKGRALKLKESIAHCLENNGLDLDFIVTESETHLRRLAASAAQTAGKYDAIVGVGGDTTFNIIAAEILKLRETPPSAPAPIVGMIGTGSANDITRGLGMESVETACRAIINGNIKKMDVGCLKIFKNPPPLQPLLPLKPLQPQPGPETFFFLGTVSLGLGVFVNRFVENFQQRHKTLSKLKPFDQLLPSLYAIYDSFSRKKIPLSMEMAFHDPESNENIIQPVEFSLLVFLNTPFYANGLKLGQDNGMFDGLLDCFILRTKSFYKTLREGIRLSRNNSRQGTKAPGNTRRVILKNSWYKISANKAVDIQVDGEIIRGIREMEISLIPGGLDVFSV